MSIYYKYAPNGAKIVVLYYVYDCVYWYNYETLVGYTWSPTASMITFKYFLADEVKHRARLYQLYFIGALLQEKVNNKVFVELDSRYADYSP